MGTSKSHDEAAATKSTKGNILVISFYLPPDISPGSLRMSGLIRGLRRERWEVSAVTAKAGPAATRDESSVAMLPGDIEVIRASHWDAYGSLRRIFGLDAPVRRPAGEGGSDGGRESGAGSGGGRRDGGGRAAGWIRRAVRIPAVAVCRLLEFPDRYAGWLPPLVRQAGKAIRGKEIDIVLSSSPPHSSHLAPYILTYLRRFKWVADFRDPWTVPDRRGKGGLIMALRRMLERRVLARCDRIIANTPGNRDALLAAFPFLDGAKVSVVTNAFDEGETGDADSRPHAAEEGSGCDLVYTGEIYLGMLDLLLDAMRILSTRQMVVPPVIHIYGLVHAQDLEKIDRLGLQDYFQYRGFVPYRRSLHIMKEAKALLLLLPHAGDSTAWVPSKLYRYLGSGRPILALAPRGDATRIIEETGTGMAVTDTDPQAVADRLCGFVASLRAGKPPVERNEKEIRRYSMESIVSQLDGILLEEMGG